MEVVVVSGSVFKRCGCRDAVTGRLLGMRCPLLPEEGHGSWFFSAELPASPSMRRHRLRRGGFCTRESAESALTRYFGEPGGTSVITVRVWSERWLASRVAIRPATRRSYRELIRNYLVPHLGTMPLAEVRTADVQHMFNSIISEHELTGETLSPATLQRIHAVVRAAFNAAIRQGLITMIPTRGVELPQARPVRAVVWSDERVAAWQRDGVRPAVAVWTAAQTAGFLRSIGAHRLYALFHVLVLTGLRRGEACGLRWTDLDSEAATLAVSRQVQRRGGHLVESAPKSNAGIRTIALDHTTLTALRQHRHRQDQERRAAGQACWQSGWMFTYADGRPVAPDRLTRLFARLVADSALPPVRLHDLRHGAASLAPAAGGEVKNISTMLGHASIQTTADTYTTVLPASAHDAAERTATMLFDTGRKTRSPVHRYRHRHVRTTACM
jgi:integrase